MGRSMLFAAFFQILKLTADSLIRATAGSKLDYKENFRNVVQTIQRSLWLSEMRNSKYKAKRLGLNFHDSFSLYVHGGRDLKEGQIATMWRLNLTNIHQMLDDHQPDSACEWELVKTTGKGPGRISHHTV